MRHVLHDKHVESEERNRHAFFRGSSRSVDPDVCHQWVDAPLASDILEQSCGAGSRDGRLFRLYYSMI